MHNSPKSTLRFVLNAGVLHSPGVKGTIAGSST
jgi:hypothetical protein